jgi:hypothetical protein
MKRAAFLFAVALFSIAYGAKPKHMADAKAPDTIEPDPDKAVLVMHSNTNFHLMKMVHDYFIGDKFIGQDKKNTWFITKVDPEQQYLFFTIKEKIYNTGKITFEAGKIYYVLRKSVPGGSIMTTQTPDDFAQYLKETETQYRIFKPGSKIPELDKDDIEEAKEEFEEEAKEDPDKHKDVLEYKGY